MKVKQEQLIETKATKPLLPSTDFGDTFSTTNHRDTITEITQNIFGSAPPWVIALMKFRNSLVRFIGVNTVIPDESKQQFKVGGYIGFFKIYSITDNEILLGEDDTHLNFRVSIFNSKEKEYNIKVSTLVTYNKIIGRVYMFFVKPFHKIVVKNMIKQAYHPL